jgi:phosphatidylglycerol:prolipoprotein diacylglycerol transferase
MFPEIVRIGPFAIYTYGLMMMLAFFVGILVAVKRGEKAGLKSGIIWDLSLWILFSSLAGARILYVLTHLKEFQGNWLSTINPIQPSGNFGIAGMDLLGGIALGAAASIWFMRRKKLNLWKIADVVAPSLALGISLGRIGCFANGCCYGVPTHSGLGMIFPPDSPAGSEFPGIPVLPTQLFEAIWAIALFAGLQWLERWKKFPGYTFSLFLIGYGIWRFFIDMLREYVPSEFLVHTSAIYLTVYQVLAFVMLMVGIILYLRLSKKAPPTKGKRHNAQATT